MAALNSSQRFGAQTAAEKALSFTLQENAVLPTAMIRYQWFDGDPVDVVNALASYQNPDGGFGNRLEPDIHHPSSNPFAARIAMQYLIALPEDSAPTMKSALQQWLTANQHDDGDWHFSEEARSGFLQPWFAAWEHPNLNPACCVASLAARLGIATEQMLLKVARLFEEKASLNEAQAGEFYSLLPYVEYTAGVAPPNAEAWYERIAGRIVEMDSRNELEDAEHFFTLALGGSPEIAMRIPEGLIARNVDSLLAEQQDDGGWPTPYDDAWRPWTTAGNMMILADLSRQ